MDKILVLSEDETTSGFLGINLQQEFFFPILANSRDAALQSICTTEPDVLIIDVPFGGMPFVELCMYLQTLMLCSSVVSGHRFDNRNRPDVCAGLQRLGGFLRTVGRLGIWCSCSYRGISEGKSSGNESVGIRRYSRGSSRVARALPEIV
jgi:hypothetical protein